ncbi:MAG: 7-carboxy-7-deazaguanine synthase QueE [Sulfurospirillaceae bacterium]|nr:7-carboxy-7-deazaguanine synthase QueE [Sulfurospirillaceae bacterium]MDD3462530.1 7-carboxy-7-deazaguanine synthase QueE [Sulfurospirillaceae bacterium]
MLKVVDIFYSIQGEGVQVGMACIFIRLYGCNLSCGFCDEMLHRGSYKEYSKDEILNEIKQYPSFHVVITGGEPSLYPLNSFIELLQAHMYEVAIETNGYDFSAIDSANWITYSPKDWDNIATFGFDEIKFIVNKNSDVKKIVDFDSHKPLYIQPENNRGSINHENLNFCIDFVKKNPKFILSVQLHKLIGVE